MGLRTLLVEDDATTRRVLEGILRGRGFAVTSVADGEAAWSGCSESLFPLVILDWMLPGIDGLELCRRIRSLPEGDSCVILLMTSRDRPQDLQAVLDAGADDYIAKPVEPSQLHVHLAIAERQAARVAQRREAQTRVAEVMNELRRSRDDMQSILNQLRIGSAMTDESGRIVFVSEMCQRLFGAGAANLVGHPWFDVWPFGDTDKHRLR
ncbi:MAG TPA: response regulator, partial [Candidatus Acidoferrales bacterium]|nr:response regulator [Candidatus Acidoferrales bacterium]